MRIFKTNNKIVIILSKKAMVICLQKPANKITFRFIKNTDSLLSI